MIRLMWALAALVLGLIGYDLQLRELLGPAGFLFIGIGIGIGCAVLGSLAHDALAGSREKL